MSVVIREYRETDRSDLVRMMEELEDYLVSIDTLHWRRRLPAYGESYTTRLLASIQKHQGIIYVAEEAGAVIGCIAGAIYVHTPEELLEHNVSSTGRIRELHICEGHRGKGIGSALMARMEEYFKEHGCEVSRTEVLTDNKHAHEFYEKLGYQDRCLDVIKIL